MPPQGYIDMRDKFIQDGMGSDKARKKAARIWNSQNPDNPVGPNYERKRRKPKGKDMASALRNY